MRDYFCFQQFEIIYLNEYPAFSCYRRPPVRRRSCICWSWCRYGFLPGPHVPIRVVRLSLPPFDIVDLIIAIELQCTQVDSWSSCIVLPIHDHHRSPLGSYRQQRYPTSSRPLFLPYPHRHPIHLGSGPRFWNAVAPRISSLSSQEEPRQRCQDCTRQTPFALSRGLRCARGD